VIPVFNSPEDILEKLYREARRLWNAENHEQAADHLFNYCVTCVALRDWIIKHLELDNAKKDTFQKSWRKTEPFALCADIANSQKHFGLEDGRKSKINDIEACSQLLVGTTLDHQIIEGASTNRPFFKILEDGGKETDFFRLIILSIGEWHNIFSANNVPLNINLDINSIFEGVYIP